MSTSNASNILDANYSACYEKILQDCCLVSAKQSENFRVNELRVESVNDTLIHDMNQFYKDWQELDESGLNGAEKASELRRLSDSISTYDSIHRRIFSSNLNTMALRNDDGFRREVHHLVYGRAPQLLDKTTKSSRINNKTAVLQASACESVSSDELVLTVQLQVADGTIDKEVEILGRQSLLDLINSVYCVHSTKKSSGEVATSGGFLFVEGVFYASGDALAANSIARIKEWLVETASGMDETGIRRKRKRVATASSSKESGDRAVVDRGVAAESGEEWLRARFGVEDLSAPVQMLSSTRCDEVPFRVGARYLYCHRQSCEHFLMVTDARQRHQHEGHSTVYPRTVYQRKYKSRMCAVCDANASKFVVFGDRLSADNPTYYCEYCHHMLHYTEDDDVLYDDFVVFPYIHD